MANPPQRPPSKRRVPGGRVTPKGGGQPGPSGSRPGSSSRYTPPVPREYKESPRWVPILMFTLLGLGLVLIFCNYLGLLPGIWWDNPPDDNTSNWWLLIGLGFILGGIITATQYR
jgi:hypothetical protein